MDSEYQLLTGALRVFDDFSHSGCDDYRIEHDTNHPKFDLLRNRYDIVEIAGSGNAFLKSQKLMQWVHDTVLHSGGGIDVCDLKDSISILGYTFGKGSVPGIFCYHIAIVFTECCLAAGLIARTIHCKPMNPNDLDTHVVSMVFLPEMNKWVLFDPNHNCCFTDKEGIPLSPLEARHMLGRDEIGVAGSLREELDWYKKYMAKNLFFMKFWSINSFGSDLVENQKIYYIAPLGFDIREREIACCEYAMKNSPIEYRKGWEEYLDQLRTQTFMSVSAEQFLRTI